MRRVLRTAALVGLVAIAVPVGAASVVAASPGKDQAILQAGVIGPADVPASWQAGTQNDSGGKQYKGIAACKEVAAGVAVARKRPHKVSPQFTDPNANSNTLAEDAVFVFKDAKSASRYLAAYQGTSTPSCLQAVVQRQVGSRGQVGTPSPITSLQGVGDESIGFEAPVQFGQGGTLIIDFIGIRVGRAFVGFTFSNPGHTITGGPGIVNAVINRVAQAGA